ncbi:MAG: chemotaxis protein CheA [Sporolactobacillus sp.]
MDMKQYLGVYVDEAREHLQNLNDKLMVLEKCPDDPEVINSIFRSAHTLKGSSGQMGLNNLMEFTHTMENVFDLLRRHQLSVSGDMIDVLFEAADELQAMIDSVADGGSDERDVQVVSAKLQALVKGQRVDAADQSSAPSAPELSAAAGSGHVVLSDYERDAIDRAERDGKHAYEVVTIIRKDCVLKAARALLISNTLENFGDIIQSVPSTEEIEREAFDDTLAFLVVAAVDETALSAAVANVSEVEHVDVHAVVLPQLKEGPAGAVQLRFSGTHMTLNEYVTETLEKALSQKKKAFEITVSIRQDCVLKAARALVISKALESFGEVIESVPPTEEIENEAFDRLLAFLLVTDAEEDQIKRAVLGISEVESVDMLAVVAESADRGDPSAVAGNVQRAKTEAGDGKQQAKKQKLSKIIRVNSERLDVLLNLFEEMIIDRSRLEKISESIENTGLKESIASIKRVSNQLQETILNLRMEPVEQLFDRFPRMVRSLSKQLGKKVELEIIGASTELDRAFIDELGDPLMHMIRNSMDHGIESPEERRSKGKPDTGKLTLRAYHGGNHVFIEIEDDGAGINREKVLKKALEKDLISEQNAQHMSDKDVFHLLFESGFSTADKVSDISGRGVGLDVVENKIRSLSGSVEVESALNKGSKFTLKLPLTLSIINALLIQSGEEVYAVPITSIHETALRRLTAVQTIQNGQLTTLRGRVVPLIDLAEFFDTPVSASSGNEGTIVYIKSGDRLAGIQTERLLGYQDIVIKPLSAYLKNVHGFSGAAILGDGRVALIIDCAYVIHRIKHDLLKQSV